MEPSDAGPNSTDLARYLEQRGELSKPWLLLQLRLAKLKEAKDTMDPADYLQRVQECHADLMRLGEFWTGREAEVFTGRYTPTALLEPLPGSTEDR